MILGLKIYEEFKNIKEVVLLETSEKLKNLLPENFKTKYLEDITKRDLAYNYDHLAISFSYNDKTIFLKYLNWLRILFDNYKLKFEGVLVRYELLLEIFKKYLDKETIENLEKIYNDSLREIDKIEEEKITTKFEDYFDEFLNYSLSMKKDKAFELINNLLKKGIDIKDI